METSSKARKAGRQLVALLTASATLVIATLVSASTSTQVEQLSSPLVVPRTAHVATTLADGRIFITGGRDSAGNIVAVSEIFDPATQTSTASATLTTARVNHTATRLSDGRVLVAGGSDGNGSLNSAEIFDPANPAAGFQMVGATMGAARSGHTATLLSDGTVLLAGGDTAGTAEIFDPTGAGGTGTFSPTLLNMAAPRIGHTATLFSSTGGLNGVLFAGGGTDSMEWFDATQQKFTLDSQALSAAHTGQQAISLSDTRLFFFGGDALNTIEEFNPSADTAPTVDATMAASSSTSTLLANGNILVLGASMAGLYAPNAADLSSAFTAFDETSVPGSSTLLRTGQTATELSGDKKILVAGGVNAQNLFIGPALFNPARIWTDKDDYQPGDNVILSGSGWKPNEAVYLYAVDSETQAWTYGSTVTADANGGFVVDPYFIVQLVQDGANFSVTAVGAQSAMQADVKFTDSTFTSVTVGAQSVPATFGTVASPTYDIAAAFSNSPGSNTVTFSFAWTGTPPAGVSNNTPASVTQPGGSGTQHSSLTLTTSTTTPAGTYSFTVTGTPTSGSTRSGTGTLVVGKANATVMVTSYTVTYDGNAHTATVTSITGVNGQTGATVGTVDVSNTTHTNAGTYSTDTWSFAGTANYNNIAATTITDTINKADATVVVTPYNVTYNGLAHTATGTATGVGGANLNASLNLTGTTHTNAGDYPSDAWTFSNSNYNSQNGTVHDSIAKANATVVVTPYNVTYDGTAHTATVTLITGVNGQTGATVGTVDVSGTTHTNASTYNDTWTFTPTANYNNITTGNTITDKINKATPAFANLSNSQTITYGTASITLNGRLNAGTNLVPSGTGTVTVITASATIGPFTGAQGSFSGTTVNTSAIPVGGPYTITYSYPGDTNFNSATDTSTTLTVTKAATALAVSPASGTYGGTVNLSATLTSGGNPVSGETVAFTLNSNSVGSATTNASGVATLNNVSLAGINAGTYATGVGASFAGDSNYSSSSGTASLSVGKANATIDVTPYSVTYDGNPHTATGTATGVNSEDLSSLLNLSGTTHTTASDYPSDPWTFAGNTNYNSASGTVHDVIGKANATITVTPYNVPYDGLSHMATGSATGVKGEALTGLDLSGTLHSNAGNYTDTWTFTDSTGNYTNTSGTVNDVISKVNATISVTPYKVIYDGNPHTATGTATGVGGVDLSGDLDLSHTTHTAVGIYSSDYWTFTDPNGNYNNVGPTTITDEIDSAATSTTLASSKNPSTFGDPVSFTATVSSPYGTPTGKVQFVIDGENFGAQVTLSAGSATSSSTSSLTPGEHVVTAVYGGDTTFTGSTSAFLLQEVNNPLTSIVVTPANPTIHVTDTQQFTATGMFLDGSSAILPGGGMWATGIPMPTAVRAPMAAAGSDGMLYFFGGQDSAPENYVQIYDPATGAWASGSSSGFTARYQGVAVAPGDGLIYVIGGWGAALPTNVVEAYNPGSNSWVPKASMPHISAASIAGAINGKIYVLTGDDGNAGFAKEFDVYDPASNKWTSLTSPAHAHATGAGGVIDGKLYVAGGYDVSTATNIVESYDPQTSTWTTVAAMPASLGELGGGVTDGILYVVGGLDNSSTPQASVYAFDGTTWSTLAASLSTGRRDIGVAALDGLLYAAGGYTSSNSNMLEVLDTDDVTWSSDDSSVATIDANTGLATGASTGTANITATSTTYKVSGSTLLTVNKKDQTITFGALADKTYGDADFTVSATASSGLTVTFTASGSCTVSGTTVHITGAGSCTVTAHQAGNDTYNAAPDVPQSFNVAKAKATVVVTPYTVTYDGNAHTATVTSITGVNGETGATVGTVDVSSTTHKNAGTYTDTWTFTGTANYSNTSGTVTDEIDKANATVVVTPYHVTYDATAHTATVASITGVNGETGAAVGGVDVSGTTHTNANTYNDTWTFTGTANYNNTSGSVTDIIDKAKATVTVTPYHVTYDGAAHTATGSVTGVDAGGTASGTALDLSGTTHTNAGDYASDAWTFSGGTNYSDQSGTVHDQIDKANATIVVTPYTVTYDGNSHTATVKSITGVNGETGATVGTVDISGTTHTNANTYNDTWTFTGTANYNNTSGNVTDIINKANATVVVTPYHVTYTGSAHTATVTSITGVNGETGAIVGTIDVSHTTHTNAGTYATDYWTFTGTANYNNIAATTITDQIDKANATVTVTGYTVTYDGYYHTATGTATGVLGENLLGAPYNDILNLGGTTHRNAFTYSDGWTFTDVTGNYNNASGNVTDIIYQAKLTITALTNTKTYDCTISASAIPTVMGLQYGDSVTNLAEAYANPNAGTGKTLNVSSYIVNDGNSGNNYIVTLVANYTGVINKANATIVVTPYNVTYDTFSHTATGTARGACGENLLIAPYNDTLNLSGTTHTNAGPLPSYAYNDTWTFTDVTGNYNNASGSVTDYIIPRNALVNYIGQQYFVTSGSSSTTAQVTLSASVQDPTGTALVGATMTFTDVSNGLPGNVLASNVKVSQVQNSPANTGTANAIVTLSTGNYGASSYIIMVTMTGNYNNNAQPIDNKTATVTVVKPAATNQTTGGGTIAHLTSAAGTYAGNTMDVSFSVGLSYNKSGTSLQGQIVVMVPQTDGSILYVKSNSISSMAVQPVANDPHGAKTSTIYTKASVYKVMSDGSQVAVDGGCSFRIDSLDTKYTTPSQVGFTVLSSKNSTLYYSNNWMLNTSVNPNVWQTVMEALKTGLITIN